MRYLKNLNNKPLATIKDSIPLALTMLALVLGVSYFAPKLRLEPGITLINSIALMGIITSLYVYYNLVIDRVKNLGLMSSAYFKHTSGPLSTFFSGYRRIVFKLYEPDLDDVGRRLIIKTIAIGMAAIICSVIFKFGPIYDIYRIDDQIVFRALAWCIIALFGVGIPRYDGVW